MTEPRAIDLSAHLAGRVWLCEPTALRMLVDQLRTVSVAFAFEDIAAASEAPRLQVDGSVARIRIAGFMLPKVSPWLDYVGRILGIDFTGTEAVRELLAQAVADPRVTSIALDINSPGGTVDGVAALADDLAAAGTAKPLTADVRDLMASAALWAGVQAGTISVGPTAMIGSLGVFTVVEDWSGAAEAAGVKVHVISSGPAKGQARGAPVSPEKLANVQQTIDDMAAIFTAAVAKGRRLSPEDAAALATGEVWVGAEAVRRRLADEVTQDSRAIKPTGAKASTETSMLTKEEQERLEAAERSAAKEKARADSLASSLELVTAQRREDIIAKYPGRVVAGNRDAVVKYGTYCGEDLAAFEAHVKSLPVQTRPDPIGSGGDPETQRRGGGEMTAEQRKLCRIFGFKSWGEIERLGARGNGILTDGTLVRADKSFVPPSEFRAFAEGRFEPLPAGEFGLV
jgi:signal peptide peptidase SppA